MCTGWWELVARDKSEVITEPFLNATVVEDSESYGCFSDLACTHESKGFQVFGVANRLFGQTVPSETDPGRRRRLPKRDAEGLIPWTPSYSSSLA